MAFTEDGFFKSSVFQKNNLGSDSVVSEAQHRDLVLLGADEELVPAGDDLEDAPLANEHDEDENALEHVQHVEEVPGSHEYVRVKGAQLSDVSSR